MVSGGAFIAALFTEIKYKDLNSGERGVIELISDSLGQNELFLKTEAVAGIVFAFSGISIVLGLIALVGRICHARHTRSNNRVFACLVKISISSNLA